MKSERPAAGCPPGCLSPPRGPTLPAGPRDGHPTAGANLDVPTTSYLSPLGPARLPPRRRPPPHRSSALVASPPPPPPPPPSLSPPRPPEHPLLHSAAASAEPSAIDGHSRTRLAPRRLAGPALRPRAPSAGLAASGSGCAAPLCAGPAARREAADAPRPPRSEDQARRAVRWLSYTVVLGVVCESLLW